METITKHIGEGFARGELYAALAYDAADQFGGKAIKQVRFNPAAGNIAIQCGDSTTAHTRLYTDKVISIYTTCASVNASTSFEPIRFNTVMTGAGQVGGRVRVNMETNVALGAWANAFKASVDWKTNGAVSGLGSAACIEMTMQGAAMAAAPGQYAVAELELVCPTSWSGNNVVSLIYAEASGATKANFDTYGYLLTLAGVSVASGKVFQANTAGAATHALRIQVAGTVYYIMLTNVGA